MVITYGATTLCHGADNTVGKATGPNDLSISFQAEVQNKRAIGAADVSLAARGNAVYSISFSTYTEYASIAAALAAILALDAALRVDDGASAKLTIGASSWAEAVVTGFNASLIGCTLAVSYAFTAAKAAS